MTEQERRSIRTLFDEIADAAPEERPKRLAAIESPTVRSEVEALLAADDSEDDALSPTWMSNLIVPTTEGSSSAARLGTRVGNYELVSVLGSGGMGDVFAAKRIDGEFEQDVAIKLIRADLSAPSLIKRFTKERQILARLNHPNIARLLDGGVSADGQPYLVMELARGQRITDYCDTNSVDVRGRLLLFDDACRAVEHAHRNLTVHCDLKPDNIVVTENGETKLLDFGIATALSEDTPDPATAMTPDYAAPELFEGQPVTTSADIYSLGVVIYELLTAQRPLELDGLTKEERLSRLRESQTTAPSSQAGPGPRGVQTGSIAADLDAICLRALHREPDERYPSARALRSDIDAFRNHRPISARRGHVAYVASKFIRRHRVAVATAVLIAGMLAALTTFYTARIAEQRDRAQSEAQRSTATAKALASVFTAADPTRSVGEPLSARDLLVRGRKQIEVELADQTEVLAELLTVLGQVNLNLGEYAEATSLFRSALVIERARSDGAAHVADNLVLLAASLREHTKLAQAREALGEARAIRETLFGGRSLETAAVLVALGEVETDSGNYVEAQALSETALKMQRERGAGPSVTCLTLMEIGVAQNSRGNFPEAEATYRRATDTCTAAFGEAHPLTATGISDLANSLRKQGRYDEAEPLYRKALSIRELLFRDDHPDLAYNINHIGRLLFQKKQFEAAIPFLKRGLAMRRRLYGDKHAAVVASMGALADTYLALDRLDDAEPLIASAVEITERLYGDDHPYVAGIVAKLARFMHRRGSLKEATKTFERALGIARKQWESDNPRLGSILQHYAVTLCAQGKRDSGLAALNEASSIFAAKYPADHPRRVELNLQTCK